MVLRAGGARQGAVPVLVATERDVLATRDRGRIQAEAVALQRGRLRHPDAYLYAVDHPVRVVWMGEVPRDDLGVVERICGVEGEIAPALRVQEAGDYVDQAVRYVVAGLLSDLTGLRAVREEPAEEILQVGVVELRILVLRRDERGHLGDARPGHETVTEEEVLHRGGPVERGRVRVVDEEVEEEGHVVVEVLPDARQVVHDRYVVLDEVLLRSHAGEQEDLRRIDGTSRDHDFVSRIDRPAYPVRVDYLNAINLEEYKKECRFGV